MNHPHIRMQSSFFSGKLIILLKESSPQVYRMRSREREAPSEPTSHRFFALGGHPLPIFASQRRVRH